MEARSPRVESQRTVGEVAFPGVTWRPETKSPEPAPAGFDLGLCRAQDAGLERVALRMALREVRGLPQMDSQELVFALRAEGQPYVRPQAWTFSEPTPDAAQLESQEAALRLRRFLDRSVPEGVRRCGIARTEGSGKVVLAAVVVDAMADLGPLPTHARLGQWIRISATLLVPASAAKLFVLGPSGAPRAVPTTLHDGVASAAFSPDREGPWSVQLVAATAEGPRPVLEAMVFVDTRAPSEATSWPAPGESAGDDAHDPAEAIRLMTLAARLEEGLTPLGTLPELEAVARRHAEAMRTARRLAHDLGDGSASERLRASGIETAALGENVAHALTPRRAHRVLWASPSHRGNLLGNRFDAMGVGVARDPDGSVWVCQLFASFGRAGTGRPVPF